MHNFYNHYNECWHGDVLKFTFNHKAYDAVVMCDVLEHLPIQNGQFVDLLSKMEGCARIKVIIFTPNGKLKNDITDDNPYQSHYSSWEPSDYQKHGYIVRGAVGMRWMLTKGAAPRFRPYGLCSFIASLTQPVIYRNPKWAFHSYAIKEVG